MRERQQAAASSTGAGSVQATTRDGVGGGGVAAREAGRSLRLLRLLCREALQSLKLSGQELLRPGPVKWGVVRGSLRGGSEGRNAPHPKDSHDHLAIGRLLILLLLGLPPLDGPKVPLLIDALVSSHGLGHAAHLGSHGANTFAHPAITTVSRQDEDDREEDSQVVCAHVVEEPDGPQRPVLLRLQILDRDTFALGVEEVGQELRFRASQNTSRSSEFTNAPAAT